MIRGKYRKIMHIICAVITAFLLVPPGNVFAAGEKTVTFTGIEAGDQVEMYRIANYTNEEYEWETRVSDWMLNNTEGKRYSSLTPDSLRTMEIEEAKEFCQTFLMYCKNESTGIVNLQGYSLSAEEEPYVLNDVLPGYYLILPKGKNRVYEIKWLKVSPEEDAELMYDSEAGDYQIPQIETEVVNVTSSEHITAIEGDEFTVSTTVTVPQYSDIYAAGKRILNTTIIIPKGLSYTEDSLELTSDEDLEYSTGEYKDVTLYETNVGIPLFFQTSNKYFYELNGEQLLASGTIDEALDIYNEKEQTEYFISKGGSNKSNEYGLVSGNDTVSNNNTISGNDVDIGVGTNQLCILENVKIFVLSIDTTKEISQIQISYQAVKDDCINETGFLDNVTALSYSVSPLDTNLISSCIAIARVKSYGIQIVLCEGKGTQNMTTEEKYKNAARLTGADFFLYQLSQTYDGNYLEENNIPEETTPHSTDSSEESNKEGSLEYYYDESENKTYEYVFLRKLTVDINGEVSLGGLEETSYLVSQATYPVGHALSDASLVIKSTSWTDEQVMENYCLFRILWLDYETVYLPGTGSAGARNCYVIGFIVILLSIMGIFFKNYRLMNRN